MKEEKKDKVIDLLININCSLLICTYTYIYIFILFYLRPVFRYIPCFSGVFYKFTTSTEMT